MEEEKALRIDYAEWLDHRRETKETAKKIDELNSAMIKILSHTEHLSKLDIIASALSDVRTQFIDAAVGKDHVPTKTHDLMFLQMSKVNSFNYKVLASVSLGLLMVIIFLLTGQNLGWINTLK